MYKWVQTFMNLYPFWGRGIWERIYPRKTLGFDREMTEIDEVLLVFTGYVPLSQRKRTMIVNL